VAFSLMALELNKPYHYQNDAVVLVLHKKGCLKQDIKFILLDLHGFWQAFQVVFLYNRVDLLQ
jgi:hypothetical protein